MRKVSFFFLHLALGTEFLLAVYSSSAYAVLNRHAVGELGQSPSHAMWTSTIFLLAGLWVCFSVHGYQLFMAKCARF
ncbi:hypothetical protein kam1_935 [Methylacidiphilum kamchatkense Kam1]|uniref:Uncharacterized protein n=1 Tax=Methylacidiphilum kamchatkense Kam1 TaxID=1202785 RepID=A0A516TLW0_9BACT|nr:hypothetical protein kam1_935 [Methylacidiphilum kamchatkense Kam1]